MFGYQEKGRWIRKEVCILGSRATSQALHSSPLHHHAPLLVYPWRWSVAHSFSLLSIFLYLSGPFPSCSASFCMALPQNMSFSFCPKWWMIHLGFMMGTWIGDVSDHKSNPSIISGKQLIRLVLRGLVLYEFFLDWNYWCGDPRPLTLCQTFFPFLFFVNMDEMLLTYICNKISSNGKGSSHKRCNLCFCIQLLLTIYNRWTGRKFW